MEERMEERAEKRIGEQRKRHGCCHGHGGSDCGKGSKGSEGKGHCHGKGKGNGGGCGHDHGAGEEDKGSCSREGKAAAFPAAEA